MKLLSMLALTLVMISLPACSKKGSGNSGSNPSADVTDTELNSIREENLPAISDADFKEFEELTDGLRRNRASYDAISEALGGPMSSIYISSSTLKLEADVLDPIKANCKFEGLKNADNIVIRSVNGCPVDYVAKKTNDMKFQGNDTAGTATIKSFDNLSFHYLSPELQKATGYISLSYTSNTQGDIKIADKVESGTVRIRKTLEISYLDPKHPGISAKSFLRGTNIAKTIHIVQRVNISLNGKPFVITYFKDASPGSETRMRIYLGNREWSGRYDLPVDLIGE